MSHRVLILLEIAVKDVSMLSDIEIGSTLLHASIYTVGGAAHFHIGKYKVSYDN